MYFRPHWYTTTAGPRPKATTSDRESYWRPNSVSVPVNRATRPSRASRIIATYKDTAAFTKFPSAPATMA